MSWEPGRFGHDKTLDWAMDEATLQWMDRPTRLVDLNELNLQSQYRPSGVQSQDLFCFLVYGDWGCWKAADVAC